MLCSQLKCPFSRSKAGPRCATWGALSCPSPACAGGPPTSQCGKQRDVFLLASPLAPRRAGPGASWLRGLHPAGRREPWGPFPRPSSRERDPEKGSRSENGRPWKPWPSLPEAQPFTTKSLLRQEPFTWHRIGRDGRGYGGTTLPPPGPRADAAVSPAGASPRIRRHTFKSAPPGLPPDRHRRCPARARRLVYGGSQTAAAAERAAIYAPLGREVIL